MQSAVTNDFDVNISGATLRVRQTKLPADHGPARATIVFLHDSLGCITLWRRFPESLGAATRCDVLIYDRRGYGLSSVVDEDRTIDYLEQEARILLELLRACEVQKAVLFGHSDGGSIALIAAASHPSLIKAVISEGAHVFVEEITLEGIRVARESYRTTDLKQRLEKYHGDKTDKMFSLWADTWLNPEFRQFNMEHFLPQIKCPVLVLQGAEDEFGTVAQVDSIAGNVSGPAQKLLIPGVAHTPHRDAVGEVLKVSTDFINKALV